MTWFETPVRRAAAQRPAIFLSLRPKLKQNKKRRAKRMVRGGVIDVLHPRYSGGVPAARSVCEWAAATLRRCNSLQNFSLQLCGSSSLASKILRYEISHNRGGGSN